MKKQSAFGDWPQHASVAEPVPYSDNPEGSPTYEMGAQFLSGLPVVADWGCGLGWFGKVMKRVDLACRVWGVDGSMSLHLNELADLKNYRRIGGFDGIFMRGVLEHNLCWRQILENACDSFTKRFVLVLYTPFQDVTHDLYVEKFGPDHKYVGLGFRISDIADVLTSRGLSWDSQTVPTATEYGMEHVFTIWREAVK